jgi:hypothetical protein
MEATRATKPAVADAGQEDLADVVPVLLPVEAGDQADRAAALADLLPRAQTIGH